MGNNHKGFTLIEIVIALTIMATLTVLSNQSIQQAIKSKLKLQEQVEEMSKVRDALRVIERDINLAYHYRDIQVEFDAEVFKQRKVTSPATNPPPPGSVPPAAPAAEDPSAFLNDPKTKEKYQNRKDPTTQFAGKDDGLDFATTNVGRIADGELMADFGKVGYSLRSCKKIDQTGNSQCLVRRFSGILEGDVTKGGSDTVLLEDVSEFKLRYLGKGKQDWVGSWDSRAGDAVSKNAFPEAVEISLSTEVASADKTPGAKKKKISMQIVAAIRFPNNPAPGIAK